MESALHHAALEGDVVTARGLLEIGMSPDVQDTEGFTPLHLAAQQRSLAVATALLEAGASVDIENSFGNTPLFVAVFYSMGRGDLIKVLRSYGADPMHANSSGQTPVELARLIANYDVSKYFSDIKA